MVELGETNRGDTVPFRFPAEPHAIWLEWPGGFPPGLFQVVMRASARRDQFTTDDQALVPRYSKP